MSTAKVTRAAAAGRKQAKNLLADRKAALAGRTAALSRRPVAAKPTTPPPKLVAAAGGRQTAGLLVAEGDSWFDYPGTDVLAVLEDEFGYDVDSVAHKGDRVEDMAYGGGQLDKFTRTLERALRRDRVPKAVLLSGGGNDIAGDEFAVLLNHRASPISGIDSRIIDGLVNNRLFYAYITILTAVTEISRKTTGSVIPILLHGYDYPVADGRGFLGGWWFLPGPWLEPGFREKGFQSMADRAAIMTQLIDLFNQMLDRVTALPQFQHVTHIDLRGTLATGKSYQRWWDNELHPTREGFRKVAAKFAAAL